MKPASLTQTTRLVSSTQSNHLQYGFAFLAGLIGPIGFAPFHLPGCTVLSVSILFYLLIHCTVKNGLILGFCYGLAYFGLGVSWVIVSIHDYGQMNYFFSALITLAFVIYLALFPTLLCWLFKLAKVETRNILSVLSFSVLWCLAEWLRSNFITGFPWLLIGTSQVDTPLKYLSPLLGVYGLGLLCAIASCLLTQSIRMLSIQRYYYLAGFVFLLIGPSLLNSFEWTEVQKKPIRIAGIQANLSMRDKWDEGLFWNLLTFYEKTIDNLLGNQLIVLPESAIPLPENYVNDYLHKMNRKSLKAHSGLLLGILQPAGENDNQYYNTIVSLGTAHGQHTKQRLVPFGEYIPKPFIGINRLLGLPEPGLIPAKKNQELIKVGVHPIASLICYEIAYPHILRDQMPKAQWIVSISDNGWFGKSFASYQQLQMSQLLSAMTGRFQVVINNDGLSSIVNSKGDIVTGLPPFSSGILQGEIFPSRGATPWVLAGDYPILFFCLVFILYLFFLQFRRFEK